MPDEDDEEYEAPEDDYDGYGAPAPEPPAFARKGQLAKVDEDIPFE